MSQEKAQLIAPLGNVTFSGVTATGVITATTLEGNITGSATSIKQGTSITAGVVTASSFAGNLTGNIQRLADSGPNISVGVVTATSFSGNLTGSVTDLTSQPAITVGVVTATGFEGPVTGDIRGNITGNVSGVGTGSVTGNVTGLASSVRSGVNLNVGVCTGIEFHGDGSNLTGAGSTAFIAQEITATGANTTINLNNGNLIYYNSNSNTTIAFSNPFAAEQIIFVRNANNSYTITWPTTVTWNEGSAPTLKSSGLDNSPVQIFRFTTGDTGTTYQAWEEIDYVTNVDPTTYTAGSIFTWGRNTYNGVLGLNDANNRSSPTQVGTDTTWEKISFNTGTGQNSAMYAIKSDATGWVWGDNSEGQQGQNNQGASNNEYSSPVQIPGSWTTIGGDTSAFGIKTDGTLWAWGRNTDGGELGLNDRTNRSSPTQIGTDTNWATGRRQLCSTTNFTMAIKKDGTMWAWGGMGYGEYGHVSPMNIKYSSPVQISGTNWNSIFTHSGMVIGTKMDNTLWTWGHNDKGMLGHNKGPGNNLSSPTQIPGTWSSAVFGHYRMAGGIKTDGTMWTWGENGNGALGHNQPTNTDRSSPTQIPGTTWSTAVGRGILGGGAAIRTDGTMWVWGSNSYGALGLNQYASSPGAGEARSSPVQLPGTNWQEVTAQGLSILAQKSS